MDIFDFGVEMPSYKPHHRSALDRTKTISMFEAFSGIGCQAMALKRLNIPYISVGISEIDKYAIMSYNAIHGETLNYGDIAKMDEIPPCDICTWSFPCTDISAAGKQKGMVEGTRSNYGYDFLEVVKRSTYQPRVLIMENVPALLSDKFRKDFGKIYMLTERMGYKNFVKVLNAKDYGVAQNRERVFMVSILRTAENPEPEYEFEPPITLTKRLKDYLEPQVDEKYYLSEKMVENITMGSINNSGEESKTIRTSGRSSVDRHSWDLVEEPILNQVAQLGTKGIHESAGRIYGTDGLCPTINTCGGGNLEPKIAEPSIINPLKGKTKYGWHFEQNVYNDAGITRAVKSSEGSGNIPKVVNGLRIRKLCPIETWRLMGISDDDFHKAESVVSNSQLFRQAGNGIVVDVFMSVLRPLF